MHGSVERGGDRLEKCLVFDMRSHRLQLLRQVDELEFGSFAVAGLEILLDSALETLCLSLFKQYEPRVAFPRTTVSASPELRASSQT